MAGKIRTRWAAVAAAIAARDMATDRTAGVLRVLVPFALTGLCLALAWDEVLAIDWSAVRGAAASVPPAHWLIAILAAGVSYAAVGRYDAILHGQLGTQVPPRRSVPAGSAAIAISQTTGFGLAVGTLVRWRLLPDMTLAQAARLTLAVTLSFLTGWAVVTALAIRLALPDDIAGWAPMRLASSLCLTAFIGAMILMALRSRVRIGGRTFRLPTCRTAARVLYLAAIDTIAAGFVFYALLPAGSEPTLGLFLPAFLLALGAGLISGTPGGLGPFELVLATLLPTLGPEKLTAAILSYRLIYFAVPAVIAGVALLVWRPGTAARGQAGWAVRTATEADLSALRRHAPTAESLVVAQGDGALVSDGRQQVLWPVGRAAGTLAALFDPVAAAQDPGLLLDGLRRAADAEGRRPCLYKVGRRMAAAARRKGWQVRPIAENHWLRPGDFSTAGPRRATLRRKLRHAEAAGVRVRCWQPGDPAHDLPLAEMARISQIWARSRGGERGFSMGRFAAGHVRGQRIYLAEADGLLLAYASFHAGQSEWALDLMRHREGCPDGTMALLILAAVRDAGAAGLARLSLAAAPVAGNRGQDRLDRTIARLSCGDGLQRFKEMFAPERTRLYVAAQSRVALALALADVGLAIRFPGPLGTTDGRQSETAHVLHEKLAFDKS